VLQFDFTMYSFVATTREINLKNGFYEKFPSFGGQLIERVYVRDFSLLSTCARTASKKSF
jgi:hypothetical protein